VTVSSGDVRVTADTVPPLITGEVNVLFVNVCDPVNVTSPVVAVPPNETGVPLIVILLFASDPFGIGVLMNVFGSRKSRADTPCRTEAPAPCSTAVVPSTPRVTVNVVPATAVTSITSSEAVSESTIIVNGAAGYPVVEDTVSVVADDVIPPVKVVATAADE
jgi:hypothetical protein